MLLTAITMCLATFQPRTLETPFPLSAGEAIELEVKTLRLTGETVIRQSVGRVRLEYLGDDAGSDVLEVTIDARGGMDEAQLETLELKPDDLVTVAEFEIETEEDVRLVRLRNWRELGAQGMRVARSMIEGEIEAGRMQRAHAERALEVVAGHSMTHDGVYLMQAKRFEPYLMGYGKSIVEGEDIRWETTASTPFADEPVPAVFVTSLNDDPETADRTEYTTRIELDRDALRELFRTTLGRVDADDDEELLETVESMDQETSMGWAFDESKGLVVSAFFERIIRTPGAPPATDVTTWRLDDSP